MPDPDVEGGLLGLSDGAVAFSNPSSATSRANMTLFVGRRGGGGIAWGPALALGADPARAAGYSSIFETDDGRLGVLWETSPDDPSATNCTGGYCQIALSMVAR